MAYVIINGDGGDNNLEGTPYDDSIYGAGGNDRLSGGAGNDLLNGGAGIDVAVYNDALSGVTVNLSLSGPQNTGGGGTDTLTQIENLSGSNFNDLLTGNAGSNYLDGRAGADSMAGLGGDDFYYVDSIWDVALEVANGGNDTVYASVNYDLAGQHIETLNLAGSGDITGTGNSLANTINGNGGNNVIDGKGGNDVIEGGLGNDSLNGGEGMDAASYLSATGGVTVNLSINGPQNTGSAGIDTLSGFENIRGSNHNDVLTGDAASNYIDGRGGVDTMAGLGGDDFYYVDSVWDRALEANGSGYDTIYASVGYDLAGQYIEALNLTGSAAINAAGNSLANTINGNGGNNVIDGKGGNDVIDGGPGSDSLSGGEGTDTLSYASATGSVSVDLSLAAAQNTFGGGTDTISGFENLRGSAFADTLRGTSGVNYIAGGLGSDQMYGGLGDDTYYVETSGDRAYEVLNAGYDTVESSISYSLEGQHVERLILSGTSNSNAGGNSLDNLLLGNDGNNILEGKDGSDLLDGGQGKDTATYISAFSGVTVSLADIGQQHTGGAGTDTLRNIENLTGSSYNDTLTGDENDNVIAGLGGNDILAGGSGIDLVSYEGAGGVTVSLAIASAQNTGAGMDTLSGFENIRGSAYADTLTGDGGDNVIEGGSGNDVIDGGGGGDVLLGGAGDDYLDGGNEASTLDFASYADAASAVTVDLRITGPQNTIGAGIDTLVSIEGLIGSAFDDILTGGTGRDTIDGGLGADRMVGGDGFDTYYVDNPNDVVIDPGQYGEYMNYVYSSISFDVGTQGIGGITLTGNENINATGNRYTTHIEGNSGDNILDLRKGETQGGPYYRSRIQGFGGNDTLLGGAGVDRLYGGTGDDILNGGGIADSDAASYDQFYGEEGSDTLIGGNNSDHFYFTTAATPGEFDTIVDFTPGIQQDFIFLSYSLFPMAQTGGVSSQPAASAFVLGTSAGDADDRLIYDQATGSLYYDADGNGSGAATLFAKMTPGTALSASDFRLF